MDKCIFVNPGRGDYRSPEIVANISDGCLGVAFVGLCIYVETFFVFPVTAGLDFFKRGSGHGFHFVKQGSAEGIAQEGIVKITDVAPETVVAVASFRNKAVDMWVPF